MPRQPKIAKGESELVKDIEFDVNRLADAIGELESVGLILKTTKLKEKAILVLLSHHTKLPQATISAVLQGLVDIKRIYLK